MVRLRLGRWSSGAIPIRWRKEESSNSLSLSIKCVLLQSERTWTHSPPSTATVQLCNVVCALMSRCLRPEAPLPLCHFGKQQNALCVLQAAPHSSLFSHCRWANGSSGLLQRTVTVMEALTVDPILTTWTNGKEFWKTLVRSVCPFKYRYCSMQARYISSYQSIPGLFVLTQLFLWTPIVRYV